MSVVHHIPGRLLFRSAAVRRNSVNAAAVERLLAAMPGVNGVEANTVTGSIVVRYSPAITDAPAISEALRERGYLSAAANVTPRPVPMRNAHCDLQTGFGSQIAGKVAQQIVEMAVERSVVALVAALL